MHSTSFLGSDHGLAISGETTTCTEPVLRSQQVSLPSRRRAQPAPFALALAAGEAYLIGGEKAQPQSRFPEMRPAVTTDLLKLRESISLCLGLVFPRGSISHLKAPLCCQKPFAITFARVSPTWQMVLFVLALTFQEKLSTGDECLIRFVSSGFRKSG